MMTYWRQCMERQYSVINNINASDEYTSADFTFWTQLTNSVNDWCEFVVFVAMYGDFYHVSSLSVRGLLSFRGIVQLEC